jgi:hypothetical protein
VRRTLQVHFGVSPSGGDLSDTRIHTTRNARVLRTLVKVAFPFLGRRRNTHESVVAIGIDKFAFLFFSTLNI